jgi:hypothetical protein|tara:strand:- start:63 stop:302 length:240 start_codon:yes stop_codon:yes gene_type:complete
MDRKIISSKDLKEFERPNLITCKHWPAFEKYDAMLECMSAGVFFVINLNDYKYTRSRGYGYAFGTKDDIGSGYGTCEKF